MRPGDVFRGIVCGTVRFRKARRFAKGANLVGFRQRIELDGAFIDGQGTGPGTGTQVGKTPGAGSLFLHVNRIRIAVLYPRQDVVGEDAGNRIGPHDHKMSALGRRAASVKPPLSRKGDAAVVSGVKESGAVGVACGAGKFAIRNIVGTSQIEESAAARIGLEIRFSHGGHLALHAYLHEAHNAFGSICREAAPVSACYQIIRKIGRNARQHNAPLEERRHLFSMQDAAEFADTGYAILHGRMVAGLVVVEITIA